MNKIKTFMILLAVSMFAASCDSYFDVLLDDQANLDQVFSEKTPTRQFLSHCYSYIPVDEETVGFSGFVVPRSDEALYSWYNYVYYLQFRTGDYGPSYVANHFDYWSDLYKGINQCTVFMDNVHKDIEDTEGLREAMKAEARFLRAYYYFCLFRQYGPVFIWGDAAADETLKGEDIDRHTVDENINFIVSELNECIEVLPKTIDELGESAQAWEGRVTKGAAMALKARVLLYAASPLYNGCDLYKGKMLNKDGNYLFPQNPDPSKWEAAASASKALIDYAEETGLYSLCKVETETTDFANYIRSVQRVQLTPWNEETIWGWIKRPGINRTGVAGESSYAYLGYFGAFAISNAAPTNMGFMWSNGSGGIAPSLKLVDSYPMAESGRYPILDYQRDANGLDLSHPNIDPESGYENDGFAYFQQPDLSWSAPETYTHKSNIGRDARFYANIVPNGCYWPNKNLKALTADRSNAKTNTGTVTGRLFACYNNPDGTLVSSPYSASQECLRVGYAWRKDYPTDGSFTTEKELHNHRVVYPAFRLAEVYLNYAECCIALGRNEEAAIYFNKVRNRAGLNNIEEAYPGILNDTGLLTKCLRKEKMVEFAFEAHRHYDACRWMIAKDEYPSANWTLKLEADNLEESYTRVDNEFPLAPMKFQDRDYLFPLSSTRLSEMVNITQNYGW